MDICRIAIHIILSIIIFCLSLRIGKILQLYYDGYQEIGSIAPNNSIGFNLVYRIIFTPIIILIIGIIFVEIGIKEFTKDIWSISLIVAILQLITLQAISRIQLINIKQFVATIIASVLLSLFVEKTIIPQGLSSLIPDQKDISLAIALAIITFIYGIFKEIPENQEGFDKRVERYIFHKYKKLSKKYKGDLEKANRQEKMIILSLMIYEDYNRPKVIRIVERIMNRKTCDILQTYNSITDEEGICKKINEIHYLYKSRKYSKKTIRKIFKLHNPYSDQYDERVYDIYERLISYEN